MAASKKTADTDTAAEAIAAEEGVLPGNDPEPAEPYAVVGEDGRRVERHLPKAEAEKRADELSARTGETFKVKKDLPADE